MNKIQRTENNQQHNLMRIYSEVDPTEFSRPQIQIIGIELHSDNSSHRIRNRFEFMGSCIPFDLKDNEKQQIIGVTD